MRKKKIHTEPNRFALYVTELWPQAIAQNQLTIGLRVVVRDKRLMSDDKGKEVFRREFTTTWKKGQPYDLTEPKEAAKDALIKFFLERHASLDVAYKETATEAAGWLSTETGIPLGKKLIQKVKDKVRRNARADGT